jgi:MFS family permease
MAAPGSPRLPSRRNFYLGLVNGPATAVSTALLATETVLAAFVVRLMGGNVIWIGLLASVIATATLLPNVYLASRMTVLPRRLPYYQFGAVLRTASRLGLVVTLIYGVNGPPLTTFLLVLGSMLVWALGAGISSILFSSIVSDSIPPQWRGRFLGWRNVIGGLLCMGGGLWLKQVLGARSGLVFPLNFALIAVVATVAEGIGVGAFCLSREPKPVRQSRQLPQVLQFLRGPRLFRRDPNYRRFLRANVAYSLAISCAVPFIVPFALKHGGVAAAALGSFVVARQLAFSLSNLVWSRISDQRGNRRLMIVTASLVLVVPLAMLTAPLLPPEAQMHLGAWQASAPAAYFVAVFALVGAATGGLELGQSNYLLEVAPPRKRATYLGFQSTVGVPLAWAPLAAALLIGRSDRFMLGFALSLLAALVCLYNVLRLSEVREENAG